MPPLLIPAVWAISDSVADVYPLILKTSAAFLQISSTFSLPRSLKRSNLSSSVPHVSTLWFLFSRLDKKPDEPSAKDHTRWSARTGKNEVYPARLMKNAICCVALLPSSLRRTAGVPHSSGFARLPSHRFAAACSKRRLSTGAMGKAGISRKDEVRIRLGAGRNPTGRLVCILGQK